MREPISSRESADRVDEGNVPEVQVRQQKQSGSRQRTIQPKWNWFVRWWNEGVDNRSTPRETAPGVVAFFFSGGPPEAHPLRNISLGGAFVYTDEHWYRGTILRMTLSDQRDPVGLKSITVNAMVGRSSSEGVAFQFIFVPERKQRRDEPASDTGPLVNVTRTQFKEFLRSVKTAA